MKKANERIRSRWPEWAVLVLFAALLTLVSVFHEPWFDEAQSWQIAKCASLRDILLEIPHNEGHPPLWHLILLIPAKLGVPFEPGLKCVGLLISTAAVAVLLFCSPFPRPVKLLLPFSYFIFYQYGVIVRPYGLMFLSFYLLAIAFRTRSEKPWRFFFALLFLCLCSAYGLVFAGGVSLVWLAEIFAQHRSGRGYSLKGLVRDRRVHALLVLLLIALLLIAEFMPRPDTYAVTLAQENSFLIRFLIMLFSLIPESLCIMSSWFSSISLLAGGQIEVAYLLPALLLGLLAWFGLWLLSPKGRFGYFAVPYLLFSIFGAIVYFYAHHTGLALGFLLFWLWTALEDADCGENGRRLLKRLETSVPDIRARLRRFRIPALLVCCLPLLIPVYWTVNSAVLDIRSAYASGRDLSQYLRETGLSERKLMGCWTTMLEDTDGDGEGDREITDTNTVHSITETTAYFDGNICFNLNGGRADKAYLTHVRLDEEAEQAVLESWSKTVPEVLVGMPDLESVYGDAVTEADFAPVHQLNTGFIWKGRQKLGSVIVYVRKDLLEPLGLEEITPEPTFMVG